MYEVEMKYADLFNVDTLNFTCENFNINDKGYKYSVSIFPTGNPLPL